MSFFIQSHVQWPDAKIAAENNLSETAFIDIDSNEIRFFTPEIEVDLCGHATLASAFIYFNFINTEKNEVTFHSKRKFSRSKSSNWNPK